MKCAQILDRVYECSDSTENAMSLLMQIRIGLHLLFCPDCTQQVERYEVTRDILRNDFLPPPPNLEEAVMAQIAAAEGESLEQFEMEESGLIPGGLSTRGWVIAGLIILVSLATVFFGFEFNLVAAEAGMSFLLPIGITVGIVLTSYGALFIGSHLKELVERFGL